MKSLGPILTLLIIAVPPALGGEAAGGTPSGHPRARLFGQSKTSIAFEAEKRWLVIYTPAVDSCAPQEVAVVAALKRIESEFSDAQVISLLPEGLPQQFIDRGTFGEPFPGSIIHIPRKEWRDEGRIAPRPRLEVWSRRGELLLMKSVPPVASEESLYREVIWARAFTGDEGDP